MIIGPSQEGALLEGSKERAKEFMFDHNIPTAAYQSFTKETVAKTTKQKVTNIKAAIILPLTVDNNLIITFNRNSFY